VTSEPLAQDVRDHVLERVERFNAVWSRFRPDSVVAEIAAAENGGVFAFPAEAVTLFELFDRLSAATDGAVDPLVGRQLELLGYDSAYSLMPAPEDLRRQAVHQRPTWAADVVREGGTLVTRRPLVVDVGAAGKGLLVDLIAVLLEATGAAEFVIDASGDLRHRGASAVRVGLEHPLDPRSVIGVVELQNGSFVRVCHEPAGLGRRAAPRARRPDRGAGEGRAGHLGPRRRRGHRRRPRDSAVQHGPPATGAELPVFPRPSVRRRTGREVGPIPGRAVHPTRSTGQPMTTGPRAARRAVGPRAR
jgi:hypothetical protein